MIKSKLLVITFICCLFIAAGCGNGEPAPEEESGIAIEVSNETEEITIAYAAFFGEDLAEWGEDMLEDEVIAPGESVTFMLPEGEYDLSLFNQDFFVIDSFFDLAEDSTVVAGGTGKTPILVQNTSDNDILFFFAFPGGTIDLESEETIEDAADEMDNETVEEDEGTENENEIDEEVDEEVDEEINEDWAELWEEIWEGEDYLQYQFLDEREVIIAENGRRYFFVEPGHYDFLIVNDEIEPFFEANVEVFADTTKVVTLE
ncbi:MAG: hypothetical protein ACQES4_05340 [Bacillota bacterium]